MTPDANEVPEPGTLAVWALIATCVSTERLAGRLHLAKGSKDHFMIN